MASNNESNNDSTKVNNQTVLSFKDTFLVGKESLKNVQSDLVKLFKNQVETCGWKLHENDFVVSAMKDQAIDTSISAENRASRLVQDLLRQYDSFKDMEYIGVDKLVGFFAKLINIVYDLGGKNISYRMYTELNRGGVELKIPNISIEENGVSDTNHDSITVTPKMMLVKSLAGSPNVTGASMMCEEETLSYQSKDMQTVVTRKRSSFQVTSKTDKNFVPQTYRKPEHKSEPIYYNTFNGEFQSMFEATKQPSTDGVSEQETVPATVGSISDIQPTQLDDSTESINTSTSQDPPVEGIGQYQECTLLSSNKNLTTDGPDSDNTCITDLSLGSTPRQRRTSTNPSTSLSPGIEPGELVATSSGHKQNYDGKATDSQERLHTEESTDPSSDDAHHNLSVSPSHQPSYSPPDLQTSSFQPLAEITNSLATSTVKCHWNGFSCEIPSMACILVTFCCLFLCFLYFIYCCISLVFNFILQIIFHK